jgi:DNA-binding NarL/FixJ family response regulator
VQCALPEAQQPLESGSHEELMQQTIVLLQSDPNVANTLAASLSDSFHRIHVVRSVDELRHAAAKHLPLAIILDLESASLADVEGLKKEFQGIRVICNHRVADEEMWTRTLSAGADDCCPSSDMRGILFAAMRPPLVSAARTLAA